MHLISFVFDVSVHKNSFTHWQVTLSNAITVSAGSQMHGTRLIECNENDISGWHTSRGMLVKFQTTQEDVQAVEQAAKRYRGNNEDFYNSLAGNSLRKYMRDPSTFGKRKRTSNLKGKGGGTVHRVVLIEE